MVLITVVFIAIVVGMGSAGRPSPQPPAAADSADSVLRPVIPPDKADDIRLLSYNIQWGMGADGIRDLDRVIEQLRHIDADIVILNEVDLNWRRSGNVDQPEYIAREADYEHQYYGSALTTWASGNMRASRYGNLLLSRFPVVSVRTVPLPVGAGRESRAAIVAQLDVDGSPWIVIGTHLGLHGGDRQRQVTRLQQAASEAVRDAAASVHGGVHEAERGNDIPVVIFGDFNARPDAPEISVLSADGDRSTFASPAAADPGALGPMVDTHVVAGSGPGYTFPYPNPHARIDYIFASEYLAQFVTFAAPLSLPGSDHLPVVADISRSFSSVSEGDRN